MGKKTPKAPDYRGAAEEQAASSREALNMQTYANRPTVNTPWGTMTWDTQATVDPATGQRVTEWTQNLGLTPDQQQALDHQQRLQEQRSGLASGLYERLEGDYADPVDWDQYTDFGEMGDAYTGGRTYGAAPEGGALQTSLDTAGLTELDPSQRYRADAEQAIYGQFESRAEPRFERERAALDTRLRNQGLRPGTEAYDNAMRTMGEAQTDARQQAQYQATIGAGSEAQRMLAMDAATRAQRFGERGTAADFANRAVGQQYGMMSGRFGQEMAAGGQEAAEQRQRFSQQQARAAYQNQLRQQQIAEEAARRGMTLNEMNAILTGQQVSTPQMPSFTAAGRGETTQYNQAAQNQYQAGLDAFNAEQAQMQGLMSGVANFIPGG